MLEGCTATADATVAEPTVLTVTAAAVDASCNGVCDGDVTSVGAGGTAPITYSWSGLGAGQDQIGTVCAGTYTVTATDANGCTATASATVAEPTLLTIAASGTNASCNGVCDGTTSSVLLVEQHPILIHGLEVLEPMQPHQHYVLELIQ